MSKKNENKQEFVETFRDEEIASAGEVETLTAVESTEEDDSSKKPEKKEVKKSAKKYNVGDTVELAGPYAIANKKDEKESNRHIGKIFNIIDKYNKKPYKYAIGRGSTIFGYVNEGSLK